MRRFVRRYRSIHRNYNIQWYVEREKFIGHTCKEDQILNENDERKEMVLQDLVTGI